MEPLLAVETPLTPSTVPIVRPPPAAASVTKMPPEVVVLAASVPAWVLIGAPEVPIPVLASKRRLFPTRSPADCVMAPPATRVTSAAPPAALRLVWPSAVPRATLSVSVRKIPPAVV